LYLLQNYATWEIANARSYATSFGQQNYVPVKEADEEFSLFKSVRDNAQLELMEANVGCVYGIDHADLSGHQLLDQDAGDYDLDIDPVPAGEVWQVEGLHLYTNRDYNNAIFRVVDGAGNIAIDRVFAPGSNYFFTWQGRFTISEGQYPQCRVKSIEDNADMTFYVWYVVLA
jgi:hypothetical protein